MSPGTQHRTGLVPPIVERSLRFLYEAGIWHRMSRNPPVRGCREAAEQRRRLGAVGIPLCDELKSLLYVSVDAAGGRRYVVVHCRGHQRLDLDKVTTIVGARVYPVPLDELAARFGSQYGTVTPLLVTEHQHVEQIVDDTVLARFYAPHTVMTNLGHLEYAVEFHAEELFGVLPGTVVADVVVDRDKRVPRHTLGVVTGNSPESGMLLWKRINDTIRRDVRVRSRGDIDFPRVIIDSIPAMGTSMELQLREGDVGPVVLDAVRGLCEAGATIIGLACNTTQYFAQELHQLCSSYGAQFASIAKATRMHLEATGITSFDLLGIGPVAGLDGWSAFTQALSAFEVHIPGPEHLDAIADLAFRAKREVVSAATVNRLRDLLKRATKTDTVLVALTELSVLLDRQSGRSRYGKKIVDTLDILAMSMAEPYLEERLATGAA